MKWKTKKKNAFCLWEPKKALSSFKHQFQSWWFLLHHQLILNSVTAAGVPASYQGSCPPSWVWATPARRVWHNSSPGRSSWDWAAAGKAAARSPWCAWWGAEGGRASAQWQCPTAWWSEGEAEERKDEGRGRLQSFEEVLCLKVHEPSVNRDVFVKRQKLSHNNTWIMEVIICLKGALLNSTSPNFY